MSTATSIRSQPYRSLFKTSGERAAIIGLPRDFDFKGAVSKAVSIRLATAFAHVNGWNLLAPAFLSTTATIHLLTGLDFCQTEPKLLRNWKRLSDDLTTKPRVFARLASKLSMFHPKALIVTTADSHNSFAIVSSGNLSDGGLRSNTECGLYTADPAIVRGLCAWYDDQWNEAGANSLSDANIKVYESKYKKVRKATEKVRKEQKALQERIDEGVKTDIWNRQKAVAAAKKYFTTAQYNDSYKRHTAAAERIRKLLHMPEFTFNQSEWNEFFTIGRLGFLVPIYRDRIFKKQTLKPALKNLLDDRLPMKQRLDSILNQKGKYHIRGLGVALVSKLLAVYYPKQWPVFALPADATLRYFGYLPPRGAGQVGRYLTFAEVMQSFMKECDAPDMLAMDTFIWHWYKTEAQKP